MAAFLIAFGALALVAAIHIRIRDMEADTSSVGCSDSFPSRGSLTGKEENANV